jgi:hypothetical protein
MPTLWAFDTLPRVHWSVLLTMQSSKPVSSSQPSVASSQWLTQRFSIRASKARLIICPHYLLTLLAFQVVLADALYAEAPFINFLWSHRKYCLIVLKDECRDIYRDAVGLFKLQPEKTGRYRNRGCCWCNISRLTSWSQVEIPLRVVRSKET